MKPISLFYFGIITSALFIASSCKEKEHVENHAVITIASPQANQNFSPGDTVNIDVLAVGETELHGMDIYIINLNSNDTVYAHEEHAHGDSIAVHQFWVSTVTTASDMQLTASVIIDHDGNVQVGHVHFKCLP